jgi:hypothetical protein
LHELIKGKKRSAYWPNTFQTYNVGTGCKFHTIVLLSGVSRKDFLYSPSERFSCQVVVAFGCERDLGVHVMGRGLLLWLLGIPLPIILLIWLFGGLHG